MKTLFYSLSLILTLLLCIGLEAQETSPPDFVQVDHIGRGSISSLAISPDEHYLAALGSKLWIYTLPDLEVVETITLGVSGALDVQWSPDGQKLAISAHNAILLLDTSSWQQFGLFEMEDLPPLLSIDWSPDSRHIVFPGHMSFDENDMDGFLNNPTEVYVWDSVSGDLVWRLEGLTAQIISVAWSPDGEKIAAGNEAGKVLVWDAHTGKLVTSDSPEGVYGNVWGLEWAPDSQSIAISSDNSPGLVWDLKHGEMSFDDPYFTNLHWSNDGRRLLGTAFTTSEAALRIWDLDEEIFTNVLAERVIFHYQIEWSTSNDLLVTSSGDGRLAVWDSSTWQIVTSTDEHLTRIYALDWSPDETRLAFSQGNAIKIWDFAANSIVAVLTEHTDSIIGIAWSSDGNFLASSSFDRNVMIWDGKSYDLQYTLENDGWVERVEWSPTQNLLAYAVEENVIIYDAVRNQVVEEFRSHDYSPEPFWSTNGQSLATLSWPNIKVWETSDWVLVSTTPGYVQATDIAWSPDGQMIASANHDSIAIWDALTGELIISWNECGTLGNGYQNISWVPNTQFILTVGCSGQVQLWNAEAGDLVDTLPITRDSSQKIIWSPSGTRFAVTGGSGEIPIWNSS